MRRARVNLRRDANSRLVLTITGASEPPVSAVLATLPSTAFRGIDRFSRDRLSQMSLLDVVKSAVSYGTSLESVSNAIAAAILETQIAAGEGFTAEAPVGLEGQDLLAAGSPALLAVGTGLFQLQPIGVINGAKGLKVLREKMRRQLAEESAALKANAEAEAARIVQRAAEVERRALEATRALSTSPLGQVPIEILLEFPFRCTPLAVGINLNVRVAEFVRGDMRWAALAEKIARTLLWVPFDVASKVPDVINSVVDMSSGLLPHASHSGTCVDLAREPSLFTSVGDVYRLARQLEEAFRVVNLYSLLTPTDFWHPVIKSVCPLDAFRAATRTDLLQPVDGSEEWVTESR